MENALVTIDGPAASGKSTAAKEVACILGYTHINSGLIYRAVAAIALKTCEPAAVIAQVLSDEHLQRDDLDSPKVTSYVSKIARVPATREAINAFIRRTTSKAGGYTLDGRAGAAEFPEAKVHIYLHASLEVRARRRHKNCLDRGENVLLKDVQSSIAARDKNDEPSLAAARDCGRPIMMLDSTDLTIEEVVSHIAAYVRTTI